MRYQENVIFQDAPNSACQELLEARKNSLAAADMNVSSNSTNLESALCDLQPFEV